MQLPVSALPEVDYPTIQVVTFYPGANPEVMSSSVTSPLERQFGQVPGLSQMTSTSSFGSSIITLQFGIDENIDVEEQQVQAAINSGSTYLPQDLPNPPIYNKVNPADAPIMTVALSSDSLPLSKVEDIADTSTNEDTIKNVTFNLGDDTGTLITGGGGSVTATSSNATLVPNLPANLSFTGSAGSRTLQITPAADQNGTTTITVTVTATNGRTAVDSFVLTVNAVNDNPNATGETIGNIAEDCGSGCTAGKYVIPFSTLLASSRRSSSRARWVVRLRPTSRWPTRTAWLGSC